MKIFDVIKNLFRKKKYFQPKEVLVQHGKYYLNYRREVLYTKIYSEEYDPQRVTVYMKGDDFAYKVDKHTGDAWLLPEGYNIKEEISKRKTPEYFI